MKISKYAAIRTILLLSGVITLMIVPSLQASSLENEDSLEVTIEPEQKISIDVEDRVVGYFYYDNFYTEVKKIIPSEGVGYSLELYKQYPESQEFTMYNSTDNVVNNILTQGYPNKTAIELNLKTDDEAYLATQVVLWTAMEDYELEKVTTNDPYVDNAIKNIYNEAMDNIYNMETENNTYIYRYNETVNEIAVYADDSIMTPMDINKNITPDGFIKEKDSYNGK